MAHVPALTRLTSNAASRGATRLRSSVAPRLRIAIRRFRNDVARSTAYDALSDSIKIKSHEGHKMLGADHESQQRWRQHRHYQLVLS